MAVAVSVVIGLVFTIVAGEALFSSWLSRFGFPGLPRLIDDRFVATVEKYKLLDDKTDVDPPLGAKPEPKIEASRWFQLMTRPPGGDMLGRVERFVLFASLSADGWPLVVAWLVFKVATNWQWARNINALPDWLLQHTNPRYLAIRMMWGSRAVLSFSFGTAANLAIALAGVGITRWLWLVTK